MVSTYLFWTSYFIAIFNVDLFTMWPTATCQTCHSECVSSILIFYYSVFRFPFSSFVRLIYVYLAGLLHNHPLSNGSSRLLFFLFSLSDVAAAAVVSIAVATTIAVRFELYCDSRKKRDEARCRVKFVFPWFRSMMRCVLYKHVEKMIDGIFRYS